MYYQGTGIHPVLFLRAITKQFWRVYNPRKQMWLSSQRLTVLRSARSRRKASDSEGEMKQGQIFFQGRVIAGALWGVLRC